MNGTKDVRDVFKEALGEGHGKNFVRGTTGEDAHKFLRYVHHEQYKQKKDIKYAFKACGGNKKWSVKMLMKQLSRKGKYVFFGATRKTCDSHKKQLKQITTKAEDEAKIAAWDAATVLQNDHAVSVEMFNSLEGTIYDNGCTSGEKVYSVQNIAERMRSLNACFYFELYECK